MLLWLCDVVGPPFPRKKMAVESPPGRGKGRQALGWVVVYGTDPPRRFATAVASRHPSREGIS